MDIVKRAPKMIVLASIAKQQQRPNKALNIREWGIPLTDSSTPLIDVTAFVASTLGIAKHGIEHAWQTGRDLTCPQPLIIRFRDTQAPLTTLKQGSTLWDHPIVYMDEDRTP